MIAVIGAGMVGCATALALHKRGYTAVVYESRPDPAEDPSEAAGRSINLALSARGLLSLRALGDEQLLSEIDAELMPMRGRMLHAASGEQTEVLYGISGGEAINSIGRASLNNMLLRACARAGIEIRYGASGPRTPQELTEFGASTVFGCDGTFSKTRGIIARGTDAKLEMETVSTYYLEVPLPAAPQWSKAHLHIWPRGSYMLIALPNPDGSFTGTLFAPREMFAMFTREQFPSFFAREFPDAAKVLGGAIHDLPLEGSKLTNVKFSPYNLGSKAILLGDAAHSMVPFYGQGLNTGLEDVRILFEQFVDKYPDWTDAFDRYTAYRYPDCQAIVNLSIANYEEMRHSVATPLFKLRKRLDNFLARRLGDYWLPLYTMVSFRPDVRYSRALASSKWQARILDRFIKASGIALVLVLCWIAKRLQRLRK